MLRVEGQAGPTLGRSWKDTVRVFELAFSCLNISFVIIEHMTDGP
jgi:hypothetical protein